MYQDEEHNLHFSNDITVEELLVSYENLDGDITVAGNEYRKEILQALVHTGVPALENYFSNLELNE